MTPQAKERWEVWNQIVARAWADDQFKRRLLSNPTSVLREHGFELAGGVEYKVVENTEKVVHLTLPAAPGAEDVSEERLSDAELEQVAGGKRNPRPAPPKPGRPRNPLQP